MNILYTDKKTQFLWISKLHGQTDGQTEVGTATGRTDGHSQLHRQTDGQTATDGRTERIILQKSFIFI